MVVTGEPEVRELHPQFLVAGNSLKIAFLSF